MDENQRKKLLRMIPYGLYLGGVRDAEVKEPSENLNAFVVSWVTQVSFKPPMVAVGVRRDSRSNEMIKASRVFTINILTSEQKDLAQTFFKDLDVTDKTMSGVPYELAERTKCPVFPDTAGHAECEVVHIYEGDNDHSVVVAKVVDVTLRQEGAKPLTHAETGWHYAG